MSVESVKHALANYEDLLSFEKVGDAIKIIPKAFIPKPKWTEINMQVKELGGRYVGGIKERHWLVMETRQMESLGPLTKELGACLNDLKKILLKLKEAGI